MDVDVVRERRSHRRFPGVDRILLVEPNGRQTLFVLLAKIECHGCEYAMLAREDELDDNRSEDMAIYLFELWLDGGGEPRLLPIDDDDVYAEVFALFSEIWDDEPEAFVGVGEA